MPIPRELPEIIDLMVTRGLLRVNTSLPCTVKAFYPSEGTADLVVAVEQPLLDPDTLEIVYEAYPMLPHVPIAYPRGGGFVVAFPLDVGDEVTAVFRSVSDSEFRSTGQASQPMNPLNHGTFHCICLPCNTQTAKALTDPIGADLVIGRAGQAEQIRIPKAGGTIQLGASGGDAVALAKIIDSFIKVFTTSWTPVAMDGGAALKTAIGAWVTAQTYTTVGSPLVKAQ